MDAQDRSGMRVAGSGGPCGIEGEGRWGTAVLAGLVVVLDLAVTIAIALSGWVWVSVYLSDDPKALLSLLVLLTRWILSSREEVGRCAEPTRVRLAICGHLCRAARGAQRGRSFSWARGQALCPTRNGV
jgi:hypothetical protein